MMLNSHRILEDKNVVITGCLRGIGRTTLECFAENGANIWACSQYATDEFKESCKQLSKEHQIEIYPVYFDLNDADQIKSAMKQILKTKKKIDALINIAGITYNALLQMTSMKKMKECFEINYFSQILITQYIVRAMIKAKSGSIIYVSSFTGMDGNPGQVAYSGSKAALIGSTKTMAMELGVQGIRVNAIAPGVIDSDMTKDMESHSLDRLLSKCAIKRKGTQEEVANLLMFLASDLSSYITGQVVRVDGGMN